jgi:hypothetical protein
MRAGLRIVTCCAALAVVAGCAGKDNKPPAKPQRAVALTIEQPSDTAVVQEGTVTVHGRVEPSTASVRVLGRSATVSGGSFDIVVPLDPGANVVDVIATAARRAPALTAFRITREILVTVPDLGGQTADDSESALSSIGLKLDAHRGADSFIDGLLPGSPKVCEQHPSPGQRAHRGSTVEVVVAKGC